VRYRLVEVFEARAGSVRTIVLPGGPFEARVADELIDAAESWREDRDVRVVVLRSQPGTDFCAGPAAGLVPERFPIDPAAALARLRAPVIAAIGGRCESVGFEVALTADIRLAAPDAVFALSDVVERSRLPCWGGTQRLPRAVGTSAATAMLLTARRLDAPAALARGLVASVDADLDAAVEATVQLLLGVGPLAAELAKEAIVRGSELPLRDGLRLEGDLNHLLQVTDDRAEGLAAFFAKRPPDFAGR